MPILDGGSTESDRSKQLAASSLPPDPPPGEPVVYFLVFETRPDPSGPDHGTVGGAFASCWAATADRLEAEQRARALLEEAGWQPAGPAEECYAVSRERYAGDERKLARFDQATTDGVAITLHTWPVGAEH